VTVTAQITSSPATSTAAGLDFVQKSSGNLVTISSETATATTAGVASATFNLLATATETIGLKLQADVAGTYQVLVTVDGNTTTGYSAGKVSTAYTITTTGAPTSLTAASFAGSVTTSGRYGQLFTLALKDANGNATVLGLNESLNITAPAAVTVQTAALATITSLGSASANAAGTYYFRVIDTNSTAIAADGTAVITFAGSGLLASSLR
jgi:hypothetical protein